MTHATKLEKTSSHIDAIEQAKLNQRAAYEDNARMFLLLKSLRESVAFKIKTWDALGKCCDEFGKDAHQYCSEHTDADDTAMLRLKTVYEAQHPLTPALVETVEVLINFIEQHKAALIGEECTWQEYEAAVKPVVAAIRGATK